MFITIAIPIYNAEKYIAQAIQSVLNQDHKSFELILINDGSTDNSMAIARTISDPRIKIIDDGVNKGLSERLNQVVKLAKYELIARMDADDIIPCDRITKQIKFLADNPEIDLVSTGLGYIDNKGVNDTFIPKKQIDMTLDKMLNGKHCICHPTLLVRKCWYQRNVYDPKMKRIEDSELWLRAYLSKDLNVGFISDIGYYYRSDNTLSKSKYRISFTSKILMIANKDICKRLKSKYIAKYALKLIANEIIFLFGLQYRLLSRNSSSNADMSVSIKYNSTVTMIDKNMSS
ncbi:glycosyltransferase family 2 protein [Shewanella sp. 10N.286.45.A1]|uniref:glycosyltransferase family 2 protein n=1 Tax=Shewanella sp. 10N.286.45.A1 TaxID=3229694 RepID=UPI003550C06D